MSVWDERFFNMVDLVATWSEDSSRKVGAVVVGSANEIRSTGYNGLPRGVSAQISKRHSKDDGEKYFWYEHAERNSIFNAARIGVSIDKCTMFTNLFPCADCARAIVQSGISTLKTFEPPHSDASYGRSFQVSKMILEEGGVNVEFFVAN